MGKSPVMHVQETFQQVVKHITQDVVLLIKHNLLLVFGDSRVTYTIHFNSKEVYKKYMKQDDKKQNEEQEEGPVVDRKCPKCNNEKMSYATLQLRSADEGQTVFYTCTKCKYKESENS